MMVNSAATSNDQSIYAALELSKNSWFAAIQIPGRDNPSLHPIKGGDTEGLMAKLNATRDRVFKDTGQTSAVTLCYEAGYDGFWLARYLEQRNVTCLVMEPVNLQVNRRARRVKTDRIDVENILHTLVAWCRGERHVCSMVVIPSIEEEDLRRCHRERDRLIRERTAHINRIKGLLFGQGIRGINVKSRYKTLTRRSWSPQLGVPCRIVSAGRLHARLRDWPKCRRRSSQSSKNAINR
ncbi:MAG: transposase [Alphaproteobacteria bacterium]